MKRYFNYIGILVTLLALLTQSCDPNWQEHFGEAEEEINMKVWDAIKEDGKYSTFVSHVEEAGLDTLFQNEQVYTLFIPTDEAFNSFSDTSIEIATILQYHLLRTLFVEKTVTNWRTMLTTSGKYALIEKVDDGYTFDGSPIEFSSPLYLDGKYYEISEVALPNPNLYEFTAQNSNFLKEYIDSKDSVYLDRSLSTPVGFDDNGNTIYDSIFGSVNLFEEEFFPITQEFRDKSATFIIFSQEQYNQALDDMASRLGGNIVDGDDIPYEWQYNSFLPQFTQSAMFDGILSYSDLELGRIKNIKGDTVIVEAANIDPDSRTICSNGIAYLYSNYSIHDTLFRGPQTMEGERLIHDIGADKYAWNDGIVVDGAVIEPEFLPAEAASSGALVNVLFNRDYTGEYSIEFAFSNLFPMKYRLEWRANSRPSGLFQVSVNGEILEYEDKFGNVYTEFDTNELNKSIISVTGERFLSEDGFNMRDYWVNSVTDYGDVIVKIEYKGSGASSTNGLNIDYIKLIPEY